MLIPIEACRKLKSLANISINIPYNTQVTVPSVYEEGIPLPGGGVSANIGPIPIETRSKQYMAEYNTDADNIVRVSLKQLNLAVVEPPYETIDFLDTVRIYISAQGQPEILVAYGYGRAGADSIALTSNNDNLKNYFISDVMYIKLSGRFNRVPAPGTTLGIYSIFNMVANPLY
jgi:hypothetical protein